MAQYPFALYGVFERSPRGQHLRWQLFFHRFQGLEVSDIGSEGCRVGESLKKILCRGIGNVYADLLECVREATLDFPCTRQL